jgi:t-SNARE complex subunit (syntaxin)
MNIDQRLEALTQTVELIAAMQRDNEVRMGRIEEAVVTLTDTMNRLANIVIRHEERLDQIDGGQ